jgi:hypothetical protein
MLPQSGRDRAFRQNDFEASGRDFPATLFLPGAATCICASTIFWQSYLIGQDYLVSFSYALSASFAVWATARFMFFRRRAAQGALGGVSLVTLLAAAGCFLIGCCGSPLLPIYVSLFGSKAAGFGKPLMALISLISIGGVYLYVVRRPECNCSNPEICPFPEKSSPSSVRQKGSTVERLP